MSEIYGVYREDGSRELPEASAATGRPLRGSRITERIPGTPYFVQYEAAQAHRITGEQRQAWRDDVPGAPMNRFIDDEALAEPADEEDDHGS